MKAKKRITKSKAQNIEMRANAYAMALINHLQKKEKKSKKQMPKAEFNTLLTTIASTFLALVMTQLPEKRRQKLLDKFFILMSKKIHQFDQLN